MQPGQAGHGRGLVAREAEATRGDDVAVHLAPAVADEVDVLAGEDLVDADMEVVHPLRLPARPEYR